LGIDKKPVRYAATGFKLTAPKGARMPQEIDFSDVYNTYYPKILKYVERIAAINDAEDIVQDVFNKVNSSLGTFKGKSKLSTWIYRIATNTVIDRTRSAAHKKATESISIDRGEDVQHSLLAEKTPSTDQMVIQKEMRACINEYIDKLPPDYKIVIALSEIEGIPDKEIAEILDISLGNAKVRLHRARARLKALLDEACEFYYTDQNTLACDRKQIKILPDVPK
jgi:RNA polymerase sigma-70 factor (ECF subfamily)